MESIPCKTCLVFPICKNKVLEYTNDNRYTLKNPASIGYYIYQNVLSPNCSILNDWMHEYSLNKGNIFNCLESVYYTFI